MSTNKQQLAGVAGLLLLLLAVAAIFTGSGLIGWGLLFIAAPLLTASLYTSTQMTHPDN